MAPNRLGNVQNQDSCLMLDHGTKCSRTVGSLLRIHFQKHPKGFWCLANCGNHGTLRPNLLKPPARICSRMDGFCCLSTQQVTIWRATYPDLIGENLCSCYFVPLNVPYINKKSRIPLSMLISPHGATFSSKEQIKFCFIDFEAAWLPLLVMGSMTFWFSSLLFPGPLQQQSRSLMF